MPNNFLFVYKFFFGKLVEKERKIAKCVNTKLAVYNTIEMDESKWHDSEQFDVNVS